MKKVIASLVISILSTMILASIVASLIYQGIILEINKATNSAPGWVCFIPACLFGIILAPFIVCLINHFKSLKLIRLNNRMVEKRLLNPILIGYILVSASIILDIIYLLFDGIFVQRIMSFSDPGYAVALFGLAHLLLVVPITMIIILMHEKKKA